MIVSKEDLGLIALGLISCFFKWVLLLKLTWPLAW